MIIINSIEYNQPLAQVYNTSIYGPSTAPTGDVSIKMSLTVYPNGDTKGMPSPNKLLLNELMIEEYGFGIDEIKNKYPENFI